MALAASRRMVKIEHPPSFDSREQVLGRLSRKYLHVVLQNAIRQWSEQSPLVFATKE